MADEAAVQRHVHVCIVSVPGLWWLSMAGYMTPRSEVRKDRDSEKIVDRVKISAGAMRDAECCGC